MTRGGNSFKPRPFGDSIEAAFPDIVRLVAEGHHVSHACELAGFNARSVRDWRAEHPDDDAMLQQARGEAHKPLVAKIKEAANADPKVLMWLLSKWRPEEYGDISKVEVTGAEGGPVQVEAIRRLSDQQLMAIAMGEAVPAALLGKGGDDGSE